MKKTFLFPDGEEHDASVAESSTPLAFSADYCFAVAAINADVVAGPPKYTIEVSIDDVNYYDYSSASTNVLTTTPSIGDCLPWEFMRIKHIPSGATEGSTRYDINIKKK